MRRSIVAFVLLCNVAVFANAQVLPKFKRGEDYSLVRTKMLKAGWKPFHSPDADNCDDDERCIGRPEMVSCSGTGMAFCKFLWKKGGRTIGIITAGEKAVFNGFQRS